MWVNISAFLRKPRKPTCLRTQCFYTLTPAGWIIACVWERCAALPKSRTGRSRKYSPLGGECGAGAETHTHTHAFIAIKDGHRCVSGKEMVSRLAGSESVLRYLGNFNLICSRSCACVRLRRFVCLFCEKTESKCSQTSSSQAQTAELVCEKSQGALVGLWKARDCCGDVEEKFSHIKHWLWNVTLESKSNSCFN